MRKLFYMGFKKPYYRVTFKVIGYLRMPPFSKQEFNVVVNENSQTWESLMHDQECKQKAISLIPPEIEIFSVMIRKITDCNGEMMREIWISHVADRHPEHDRRNFFEKMADAMSIVGAAALKLTKKLLFGSN